VIAYTRNGFDWTDRYPLIVEVAARLRCKSAMLDGEVIVQDARGASDFDELQKAIKSRRGGLIFYAFDLLHIDGKDLRGRPLTERRRFLKKLIGHDPASPLQFSEEYVGNAEALFRACAELKLEGIVSKLATSRYQSGRSNTWLKTKCFTEGDFILLGIDASAACASRKVRQQSSRICRRRLLRACRAGSGGIGIKSRGSDARASIDCMAAEPRCAVGSAQTDLTSSPPRRSKNSASRHSKGNRSLKSALGSTPRSAPGGPYRVLRP
jgi:ATP-dependent DNA ligase